MSSIFAKPPPNAKFFLRALSTSQEHATANHGRKNFSVYDRKITFHIFFCKIDRPSTLGYEPKSGQQISEAFIPQTMVSKFPNNFNSHPMVLFNINENFLCMKFVFHVLDKYNLAITRNYWRAEKHESAIEAVKNLGKFLVVESLARTEGVKFILPHVNQDFTVYSAENILKFQVKIYSVEQLKAFFTVDNHSAKLGPPW